MFFKGSTPPRGHNEASQAEICVSQWHVFFNRKCVFKTFSTWLMDVNKLDFTHFTSQKTFNRVDVLQIICFIVAKTTLHIFFFLTIGLVWAC